MNMTQSEASLYATHRFTLHGTGLSDNNLSDNNYMSDHKTFFAYHMSLFNMPPHKFQMVLRIELSQTVQDLYLGDLQNPQGVTAGTTDIYYSLDTNVPNQPEFQLADIYFGNFNRFVAYVERIEYNANIGDRQFKKLPSENDPMPAYIKIECTHYLEALGDGSYSNAFNGLLFGSNAETFLAHRLAANAPNWDEVRAIRYHDQQLMPRTLDDVALVTIDGVPDALEGNPTYYRSPFSKGGSYNLTVTPRCGGGTFTTPATMGEQQWWNSTTLNQ